MPRDRESDITLFGATGFVGQLVAAYLAEHAPDDVRVALAGRSEERLSRLRAQLGKRAASWPLVVADSENTASLKRMANTTRVVVTTVGPYRSHGLRLVAACASAGTDYADLTGEVLFMRDSVHRYHTMATEAGARIVHACGFDSIPSDLGVMLLHQAAAKDRAGDLEDTTLVVAAFKGTLSGGTFASAKGQVDELRANPRLRRIVFDPYALSPERAEEPDFGAQRELSWIRRDDELGMWVGPFIMSGTNTRVVRRSNALQGWAYGRHFRYQEVTAFGTGPTAPVKAAAMSAALTAFAGGLTFGPSRALLDRVLPKPGEGPSAESRRRGFFRIEVHARTSTGAKYVAHIAAEGDPGYAATSVMLGEAGLCLALDQDRSPRRAGVLTPATAMGDALVARLRAAGQTLKVSAPTTPAR